MFSTFMLPGLLLAIGISGIVWWTLKEFTHLSPEKVDGLSIVVGLGITILVSLLKRGLWQDPLQILVGVSVLALSYLLSQRQYKNKYKAKKSK